MDIDQQVSAIAKWMRVVEQKTGHLPSPADADHSSLLRRLLAGHAMFPFEPPRRFSYPDYRLAGGDAVMVGECWAAREVLPGATDSQIVDQSAYNVIERRSNGTLLLEWPGEPGSRYEVSLPDGQGFCTMQRRVSGA